MERLILIGGCLSLLIGVGHGMFDQLFRWKSDLGKLSVINAKALYTIHLFLIPFFFFFAFISLFFAEELARPRGIAKVICVFYTMFWLARGIWQLVFFQPRITDSKWKPVAMHYGIAVICALLALLYGLPVFLSSTN